jgi:hypothetical protein
MSPAGFAGPEHKPWILGMTATDDRPALHGAAQLSKPAVDPDGWAVMPVTVSVRVDRVTSGRTFPKGNYYVGRLSADPEGVIRAEGPMTEWKQELTLSKDGESLLPRPKGLYERIREAGASVAITSKVAAAKGPNGEVILLPHVVIEIPKGARQGVMGAIRKSIERAAEAREEGESRYVHKQEAFAAVVDRLEECLREGNVVESPVSLRRFAVWPRNQVVVR